MKLNEWKSPLTLISLSGLILSILVNVYQFSITSKNSQIAEEKLKIETEKLTIEKGKWELEKKELTEKLHSYEKKREYKIKWNEELNKVLKNISIWDNALTQDKLELMTMNNDLPNIENKFKKEAQIKNIKIQEYSISSRENELKKFIKRRDELERLLNQ